jgi:hypothetical protein
MDGERAAARADLLARDWPCDPLSQMGPPIGSAVHMRRRAQ